MEPAEADLKDNVAALSKSRRVGHTARGHRHRRVSMLGLLPTRLRQPGTGRPAAR